MKLEIMDTTLRDGEQTPGVAFTDEEKLTIAKILLDEVKVDRIEVASARISKGELESVKKITTWCKDRNFLDKVEVLGFVDGTKTVDWIVESGARTLNLLCKGSLNHVENQLNKSPEEHISDIKFVISKAKEKGIKINLYLEDWSNGMLQSPEYVFYFVDSLRGEVERFMLADTLGILSTDQTYSLCRMMVERYPDEKFDFHAHNDYDMAVANTYMAVKAGVKGAHVTVNGLGERTGNAILSSVIGVINDHYPEAEISVDEGKLNKISKMVEAFSGIRVPKNQPMTGENVFTQTCGVHADGDNKGGLYFNRLTPERFGRTRRYALGKTSGKASIVQNLNELGMELDKESIQKITNRVVQLGDKKNSITTEDLPYIISDVLGSKYIEENIKLINYYICNALGLNPVATICLEVYGERHEETATGDGQYDSFMKALKIIYQKLDKKLPELVDYEVAIPPGGKTNALVETVIIWHSDKEFRTRGLDSDQTASAIKATVKMLNLMESGMY